MASVQRPNSMESPFPGSKGPSYQPTVAALIEFDQNEQDIGSFQSDYSSQVYEVGSVVSNETEKKKVEIRNKVAQYLNTRKSVQPEKIAKRMAYQGDLEDNDGDILNELDHIEGLEKIHGENEKFILEFNKKPEAAINQYIKKGIIASDSPDDIAKYLIKIEALDKEMLGNFFGQNNEKALKILHSYCKYLNLNKVEFDIALRLLLSKFQLPKEAQQIQRIVWEFSLAFYEVNNQDYDNADELFPLSYAIIMLGTDAHSEKQEKKMTKAEFVKNTQRPCPSLSDQYLEKVYDRITTQKFQTQFSEIERAYAWLKDIVYGDSEAIVKVKAIKQLKKGDVFVKACRNTKQLVQRKLYLSEDQKRIEWVSVQNPSEKPRFIEVKDITDLMLGVGSAVMKMNKVPQHMENMCFTIFTTHRTLDLKAKSNKERGIWLNFIRSILIKKREELIHKLEEQERIASQREHIEQIWNTDIFPNWDTHWDYKNKKPLVRNAIVRGIEAICCFWRKQPKTSDGLQNEGEPRGLKIRTTKLEALWTLGLPANSRKVLWPLVIGNNLALSSVMLQQIKKRTKPDQNVRKFVSFSSEALEMAQVCRHFRPDIPALRDLLNISQIFAKAIPKINANNPGNNSQNVCLNAYLNVLHLDHFLSFFRGDKNEIDLRIQLFEFLLEKNAPRVRSHFEVLRLETRMYLVNWFMSVFISCFQDNEEFTFRIWDNFLLEGENYLFKVGITIIKYYEVELKMCTFHEGLKILRFPKATSPALFFHILHNGIDVSKDYFTSYIETRKHAIIKTKVQSIPLE